MVVRDHDIMDCFLNRPSTTNSWTLILQTYSRDPIFDNAAQEESSEGKSATLHQRGFDQRVVSDEAGDDAVDLPVDHDPLASAASGDGLA